MREAGQPAEDGRRTHPVVFNDTISVGRADHMPCRLNRRFVIKPEHIKT